ncbi:MAG: hypothetical protein H6606_06720 [Flavobacteriales bacterium]|nr:hypothetical protein [Flavobacteriales bacterium]
MGSSQKIADGRIAKFLKVSAFVTVPLVALGAVSIFFQWSQSGDREFGLYDFDLGALWPWSEKAEVRAMEQTPELHSRTLRMPVARPDRPIVQTVPRIVEEVRSVTRAVKRKKTTEVPLQTQIRSDFQPIKVQELDIPIFFLPGKSKRFMELSERENLIPRDIENSRGLFALGASFAPSFTYRNLRYSPNASAARVNNNRVVAQGQSEQYRDRHDAAILNFYSGIDFYWQPNKVWSVQSGIYYASFGEQLRVSPINDQVGTHSPYVTPKDDPFYGQQVLFNSPEVNGADQSEAIPFNNYFGFIEIPLTVAYRIGAIGSMGVELQGTLAYSHLFQVDALLYNYNSMAYCWISESQFGYFNRHFLQAGTGVSFSQYFSKDVELFANPQFRYSLTPTFKDSYEILQNQMSLGLRLGMKVHL